MIKEIICIGTSFTEASGLNPKKPLENKAVEWYKENKNIIIKSLSEYSWPNQLSEISGIKTRNLGKCGSSIEYLMRNVEEIIESEDCSDKLFILEYSSWGRSELWTTKHNQWLIANWGHKNGDEPSDGYATMLTTDYNFGIQLFQDKMDIYNTFLDNFFNESEFLLQRDRHFLNLLYKLKSKNINYQIIPLEGVYLKELEKNSLFNTNKLGIKSESLWDYVHKMGWDITSETNGKVEDGHPSISGHKKLAELLYEKIIKDKK
jgi:hypothetical protein